MIMSASTVSVILWTGYEVCKKSLGDKRREPNQFNFRVRPLQIRIATGRSMQSFKNLEKKNTIRP